MRIVTRRLRLGSTAAIAGAAVLASAWFATRAWSHVANVAQPARAAAVAPPIAPVLARAATPADPRSSTAELVARNMFCSSCPPPRDDGPDEPGVSPVARVLPRVIATQVGRYGWATLEAGNVSGAFVPGAALPGGGVLDAIEPGAIVVRFDAETTVRVPLAGEVKPDRGGGGDTAGKPDDGAATADPWADRIRAVGDNRWEVDRTLIRELVAAGTGGKSAARGVRLQPVNKDGQLAGVRVTAARTGSLATALGLSAGDVIESIDGRAIDSPQVLMSMYDKLDGLRRVDLGVRRKGSAVTLTYDLP